jgi:hypothetical protein
MSRYADAAFEWLKINSPKQPVPSDELWRGMQRTYPELTAVLPNRRTPRNTTMRDLRTDRQRRFIVADRRVWLRDPGKS